MENLYEVLTYALGALSAISIAFASGRNTKYRNEEKLKNKASQMLASANSDKTKLQRQVNGLESQIRSGSRDFANLKKQLNIVNENLGEKESELKQNAKALNEALESLKVLRETVDKTLDGDTIGEIISNVEKLFMTAHKKADRVQCLVVRESLFGLLSHREKMDNIGFSTLSEPDIEKRLGDTKVDFEITYLLPTTCS